MYAYTIKMWLLARTGLPVDDPATWEGMLLPMNLIHPREIRVEEIDGRKVTAPQYDGPVDGKRPARLVTDGVYVHWRVPALEGAKVLLPPSEETNHGDCAWRAGGVNELYVKPPHASKYRKRTASEELSRLQRNASEGIVKAASETLTKVWGPRETKGYCPKIVLRLAQPNALVNARAELTCTKVAFSPTPGNMVQALLSLRAPPLTVVHAACRNASCQTLFCKFVLQGTQAQGKAVLKRRVDALEGSATVSPTRAAQKGRAGPKSPGAGIVVEGGGASSSTADAEPPGPPSKSPKTADGIRARSLQFMEQEDLT